MPFAVVFPGQGTQSPGMGEPWRDHAAWSVVEQAEAAFGEPLAPLLLQAPAEQLARTRDAQLAILLTSLVAWEAVRSELPNAPVAFAGHSLGQVTALIADRTAARARKDWKESDRIRDELAAMGVAIKDSKEGTTWEIAR